MKRPIPAVVLSKHRYHKVFGLPRHGWQRALGSYNYTEEQLHAFELTTWISTEPFACAENEMERPDGFIETACCCLRQRNEQQPFAARLALRQINLLVGTA